VCPALTLHWLSAQSTKGAGAKLVLGVDNFGTAERNKAFSNTFKILNALYKPYL
jgi:hypothetical protein